MDSTSLEWKDLVMNENFGDGLMKGNGLTVLRGEE
ncbi:hypothetical protein A2U01_0105617, partial [Trifolium medium]|nr:hypothetical protein [Trifolium medium]